MIKIDKIQLHNFRFFIDEDEHNSFELNGQNMLVYGENGSGKSSLYKAFEFLVQPSIEENQFNTNKNIFNLESDTYLEFNFDNEETLRIDSDHLDLENNFSFIEQLSISKPILDYKSLLNVSYSIEREKKKNLYKFFEDILAEYPIGKNKILKNLKEQEDEKYFSTFEKILKEDLLDSINTFLDQFEQNFKLTEINFNFGFHKVNLEIEYFDNKIEEYQNFLNEARLSALAISIYFSIIKKQFDNLSDESLKILVLDDLLISLDMSNRLNLIEVIKTEFSDFQIFFFTHDKGFFEILKDKMPWKAYEIYVDSDGEFEKPYIKKSLNYFESAIKHFNEYDYPACANYLRKEVERLKSIKERQEQSLYSENEIFKKIKKTLFQIDLTDESKSGEIRGKLLGFKKGLERDSSVEIDLRNIRSITDRILNPQSHDDTSKPLFDNSTP